MSSRRCRQGRPEKGAEMAPAIIMVRPQLPENIGAAARAMMNFGLSELRLVAPRCKQWPHPKAYEMAAGADALLDSACVFDTTGEAIADLTVIYGTSARERDMPKPVDDLRDAMAHCAGKIFAGNRCGILLGPERTGLINDDIMLCDRLVTIPTSPVHSSLNVAQALVVVGYEWFTQRANAAMKKNSAEEKVAASKEEVQGFFDHLEALLDEADFFKTPQKKPKMWWNLRTLFLRAEPTPQEIRTLRGMIRALACDIGKS